MPDPIDIKHFRNKTNDEEKRISRLRSFDGGSGGGYDDGMEERLKKLEEFKDDARERLARIEVRLEHTATKDDVARLESTLLKWFVTTAIALTGLAFAAAKLIH